MLKKKNEQKGLLLSEKEPQTYQREQGEILADSRSAVLGTLREPETLGARK